MTPDEIIKAEAVLHRLVRTTQKLEEANNVSSFDSLAYDINVDCREVKEACLKAWKTIVGEFYGSKLAELKQEAAALGIEGAEGYVAAYIERERVARAELRKHTILETQMQGAQH